MTYQTSEPLQHQTLQASNRSAQEVVRIVSEHGDISPSYQRGSVWTLEQRMGLVKSWLIGLPIPAVIVNDRFTANWPLNPADSLPEGGFMFAVIDGKQRIETARMWLAGDLAVPASWWESELIESTHETDDGPYVTFTELTVTGQRKFSNRALLPVIEAKVGSIAEEAALFLLINGSGTAQTAEDMAIAAEIKEAG